MSFVRRALVVLGVSGVTITPLIASARHLQPAEGASAAPSPSPAAVAFVSAPAADAPAVPEMMIAPRRTARHRPSSPLDVVDPWDSAQSHVVTIDRAIAAPRPLDTTDPWGGEPSAVPAPRKTILPAQPVQPAPETSQQTADAALRQAIKAAVDAGDLERAAKLIDVLRATKKRAK